MNIDLSALSASELDELIAEAADRRANLNPEVSLEPPQSVARVMHFAARATKTVDGTLLQLRHPGLGWVAFQLSPEVRAELAKLLVDQATSQGNEAELVHRPGPTSKGGAGSGNLH